jgi:type IV pilus assembly protein PilP
MSHLSQNQRVKPSCALLFKTLALGLVLIFVGCESEPPQKAAPTKVVRKKIGDSANAGAAKKTGSTQKPKASKAKKQTGSSGTAAKAAPKKAAPAKTAQSSQTQAAPSKDSASKTASTNQAKPPSKPGAQPESGKTLPAAAQGAGQGQPQGLVLARRPPVVVIDPFEPLFRKEQPQKPQVRPGAQTQTRRPVKLTPLEKIDLGQLKLTAIIRSPVGKKALVEEASGKGYIIEKGTWIGVHAGKVMAITGDTVVVEEEVENALGEISLTKRELKLQKPPGE